MPKAARTRRTLPPPALDRGALLDQRGPPVPWKGREAWLKDLEEAYATGTDAFSANFPMHDP